MLWIILTFGITNGEYKRPVCATVGSRVWHGQAGTEREHHDSKYISKPVTNTLLNPVRGKVLPK